MNKRDLMYINGITNVINCCAGNIWRTGCNYEQELHDREWPERKVKVWNKREQ